MQNIVTVWEEADSSGFSQLFPSDIFKALTLKEGQVTRKHLAPSVELLQMPNGGIHYA